MLPVIKIEAHTNAQTGFHAKAKTESVKIVAQVDKGHYTYLKN